MTSQTHRVESVLGVIGRLIALAGATALVLFLIGIMLKPLLPGGLPRGEEGRLFFALLIAMALSLGHIAVAVLVDRGHWGAAGLAAAGWHPVQLLLGVFAGLVAVILPAGVLFVTGISSVEPAPAGAWAANASQAMLGIVLYAVVEELAVRGYVTGLAATRFGAIVALAVSAAGSTLFAMQRGTDGAALIGAAAVGLFLGAVRVRTGGLAAAVLAHVAMGVVLVILLGAEPSVAGASALGVRWIGGVPDWLTGGTAGPMAGAAAALTLVVVSFLLLRPKRRASPAKRA